MAPSRKTARKKARPSRRRAAFRPGVLAASAASVAATAISCAPLHRGSIVERLNVRAAPAARLRLLYEHPMSERLTIAKYQMHNGLTILLLHDPVAPVFSYAVWFRVGSRHERPGKTGLAHLFEHLMFNETEHLRAGEFDRAIEQAGGQSNAATWTDWTFYYESLPTAFLPMVVRMEADRMQNLVLRDPQVTSERQVVANERRYRVDDDVEGKVNELLYENAFTVHPYHWPTIGWMRDIEGFNTTDCRAFYRTYYAPNNATLVVVGDFDEPALLRLLQRHYGAIRAQTIPVEASAVEPPQTRERRIDVTLPSPTEKLQMGYRVPGFSEPDHVVMDVVAEILFGGRSSRLVDELVVRREIAADARGSVAPFRDPGLFEIYVSMREGHPASEAAPIVDAALGRLEVEPVTEAELEKAKNRLTLGFYDGLVDARGKAEQLGLYETITGDFRNLFTRVDAYRAVTAADVQRVARALLDPRGRTVVVAHPRPAGPAAEPAEPPGPHR